MYDVDSAGEVEATGVTPIIHPNPMEEAAQRFWRASMMWRGLIDTDWTIEDILHEVSDIQKYRGPVAFRAQALLADIINDARPGCTQRIEQAMQEQF